MGFRQFVGDPDNAQQPASPPQKTQNFLRPQDNKRSPPQSSSQIRSRSVSAPSDKSTTSEATVVSPRTPENDDPSPEGNKVGNAVALKQTQVLTLFASSRNPRNSPHP